MKKIKCIVSLCLGVTLSLGSGCADLLGKSTGSEKNKKTSQQKQTLIKDVKDSQQKEEKLAKEVEDFKQTETLAKDGSELPLQEEILEETKVKRKKIKRPLKKRDMPVKVPIYE